MNEISIKKPFGGIDAFTLKVIAITAMLVDHVSVMFLRQNVLFFSAIGRAAFPIFAFMIVEGYFHTSNIKKYLLRMFVFALVSEIPFNLMMGSSVIYPYHQNVIFTLLLGLLCIAAIEAIKKRCHIAVTAICALGIIAFASVFATLTLLDYYGFGIMTIMVFYLFRGKKWAWVWQIAGLYYINFVFLAGLVIPIGSFEFPVQGFALLSLIPIWLYNGKVGLKTTFTKYMFYIFYPLHMLIIALVFMYIA